MPRGSRPSTAAFTSSGARNASEIVISTCRMLHLSRAAICSTLVTVPATTSSSQRRPRVVAACGDETAGGLGKMLMASQDVDQMVDVGAAMSGVQLDSKPR